MICLCGGISLLIILQENDLAFILQCMEGANEVKTRGRTQNVGGRTWWGRNVRHSCTIIYIVLYGRS